MISIHRVRSIRAHHPYPEANYIKVTIASVTEEVDLTLFTDYNVVEGMNQEYAAQLAKAINSVPTAAQLEADLPPEAA